MKILITGAKGFIGKNLVETLKTKDHELYLYDKESTEDELVGYLKSADFIYHLAGVNRPKDDKEFHEGNVTILEKMIDILEKEHHIIPIMLSSSIQATLDVPYGKSKKEAEDLLVDYAKKHQVDVYIYRFPNVFGKWSRPFYNSVVSTFCHQVAHGNSLEIHDKEKVLELLYIDDLVKDLLECLNKKTNTSYYCEVKTTHKITLQDLADTILSFRTSRTSLDVPNMGDPLTKKLYATYLTYIDKDAFSYPLKMNKDHRGSFTEFLRTSSYGQVSVNISLPGITKGNHWHHTKNEKFLVVSGKGAIRFRHIHSDEVIEYLVSGDKLEVVDIPPGYTHQIENLGSDKMVTIMWANEAFDKDNPDTIFLEV